MTPRVIFFLGPPGVGKGTQSQNIIKEFGFKHVCAGDCLREELNNEESPYRELIKTCIAKGIDQFNKGEIVPCEITVILLENKMRLHGWENTFIIDGFPRSNENLIGWNTKMLDKTEILGILSLYADSDVIFERIKIRLASLGRVDDDLETLKNRLRVFQTETSPIINSFLMLGKCEQVDGNGTREEVWERTKVAVEKLLNN